MSGAREIVLAWLAAGIVRALGATIRVRVLGAEALTPYWTAGRPLIYATWHGRMLMMPWANHWLRRTRGARTVAVLASRSRDGEIVTRYAARFGLRAVRGSSSRAGAGALRALVATVRGGADVALVPDGPRGPRGHLQPGVVALAALTGAPVVPTAFAAAPAWRLRTWDELLVPLPFARGALAFGGAVHVDAEADRERTAKDLARALDEVTAAADRAVT